MNKVVQGQKCHESSQKSTGTITVTQKALLRYELLLSMLCNRHQIP